MLLNIVLPATDFPAMPKVVSTAIDAHSEKRKRQPPKLLTESNKTVTKPYLPVRWSPIIGP